MDVYLYIYTAVLPKQTIYVYYSSSHNQYVSTCISKKVITLVHEIAISLKPLMIGGGGSVASKSLALILKSTYSTNNTIFWRIVPYT